MNDHYFLVSVRNIKLSNRISICWSWW